MVKGRAAAILCKALLLLPLLASARGPAVLAAPPRFEKISDSLAIGDGVVTALAQDASGMLWLGSSSGLVRYDGYRMHSYRLGGNGSARFVRTVLAARDGAIWLGSDPEGLFRFDPVTERWTTFPVGSGPQAISNAAVRTLAQTPDGAVWIGTQGGGLNRYEPATGQIQNIKRSAGGLPDNRIFTMLVDRDGDLWAGTWNGLVRCRAKPLRCAAVSWGAAPQDSMAELVVSSLMQSPDGRIWAGARSGQLARIDPRSGKGEWLLREHAPDRVINAMVAVNGTEVWVSTNGGLDVRAADSGALLRQSPLDLDSPLSIGGTGATMLKDRSGWIWAGSYGGGLRRHNPTTPGISVLRTNGQLAPLFVDANVHSILQLQDGQIWFGLRAHGIAVMDENLRYAGAIAAGGGQRAAMPEGFVGSMAQSRDGRVWAAVEGLVLELSPQRQVLRRHSISRGRIRRVLVAADGQVWVGAQDGAYRLDPASGTVHAVPLENGKTLSANVDALVQTSDGAVWLGGAGGLYRCAPGQDLLHPLGKEAGLPGTSVVGMLLDRRGQLWLDSDGGLFLNRTPLANAPHFEAVGEPDGRSGRDVGANLLEDREGRIWTQRGVYDLARKSYYALTPADGADIGTPWFRSYAQLRDGRMLFGGTTGVLVVTPEAFRPWNFQPRLAATDLRIDGVHTPLGQGIVLRPGQHGFALAFAALDLSEPGRNRYRYLLEGEDPDWIAAGAEQRIASYSKLAPGHYRLRIQGSNRIGQWSPHELTLTVEVQPQWWQTWWARLLFAAAAAGAIWGVVQLRTATLRRRQAVLEAHVAARTAELRAATERLKEQALALEQSSLTDPLTGLRNRRFLDQHIGDEVALALRRRAVGTADGELIFFLADVDHFKKINDEYGHAAGDSVLVQMRERLQSVFRESDYLIRWGGEEFLVVARDTSRQHAPELAERVRRAVADTPFVLADQQLLAKTCSIGFACFPLSRSHPQLLSWQAAVEVADAALYASKHGGRNAWHGLLDASALDPQALQALPLQAAQAWLDDPRLATARSAG